MTERGEYTPGHFTGNPTEYKTKEKTYVYTVEWTQILRLEGARGFNNIEYKSVNKKFLTEESANEFHKKIMNAYQLVSPNMFKTPTLTKEEVES